MESRSLASARLEYSLQHCSRLITVREVQEPYDKKIFSVFLGAGIEGWAILDLWARFLSAFLWSRGGPSQAHPYYVGTLLHLAASIFGQPRSIGTRYALATWVFLGFAD